MGDVAVRALQCCPFCRSLEPGPGFRRALLLYRKDASTHQDMYQFLRVCEGVASSPVVAVPGLVLASPAPTGPGPDRVRGGGAGLGKAGQQAAGFRQRAADHAPTRTNAWACPAPPPRLEANTLLATPGGQPRD